MAPALSVRASRGDVLYGYYIVAARFMRRNPLSLLILLIPLPLLFYGFFDPFRASSLIPAALSPNFALPLVRAPNTPPPVLLVSAYFPLSRSKHTQYQYYQWISGFLGRITSDVYMFTPPEMEPIIRDLRGPLPIHINTTFLSAFHIPPFQGLRTEFESQHSKDREAHKHTPELYAIWAAKPYFVKEAIANVRLGGHGVSNQTTPYHYVLWFDAGSMRESHAYMHWPSIARIDDVWTEGARMTGTLKEDLVLIPLEHDMDPGFRSWQEADGPVDMIEEFSEGSLIAGTPRAMEWWYDVYMTYFLHYMRKSIFVGKDQTLMNALFLLFPERFITVWNRDPFALAYASPQNPKIGGLGYCNDPWFYYHFWLANEEEREAMNAMWMSKWRFDFWRPRGRELCRMTGVLSMEMVLKRAFGQDWRPPKATLSMDGATA